jgi:glycosyltransferase involved in cell wall biosynthesis
VVERRVLVIAYDFPPRRTSAVYRVTGLTKYLGRFGWKPVVLTIQGRPGDIEDPLLLQRIPPGTEVVRTKFMRISGWENRAASTLRKAGALGSRAEDTRQPWLDRVVRRLGDFIRSCIYFPDDTVGWVPYGFARAVKLHRQRAYDVVYTTSPPHSAPVIGLLLKTIFGIPWVAEFRDPWKPPKRLLRTKFERWLQLAMLRKADVVVVHSKGYGHELRDLFGVPENKILNVSNGYDEDDFNVNYDEIREPLPPGYIHLSHFGTVYPQRSGRFFPTLAEFIRECPEAKSRLRVNIIGFPDVEAQRYAFDSELRDVIKIYSFMPHFETLKAMKSSRCLLLFWSDPEYSRLTVAGKLYEYLRVGRPILALDHAGETKELIEGANAGWVVHPEDSKNLKQVLRRIVSGCRGQDPPPPETREFVAQFRYDRLAGRLAGALEKAVTHGR